MTNFLRDNLYLIAVFITGACVLVVEVVAVRVLSPYYGNTIYTVSSIISVILAALSIGYYVGGKFADKHPSPYWFFRIILVSGVAILALHLLGMLLLPLLSIGLSLASGPLVSSLLLFFLPALLLGTLSPYAIKLQSLRLPDQGIGGVSGKIFFWSTLGSIIGSLLAGFVLIPKFGIDHIFIGTGLVLFCLGLIPLISLGYAREKVAAVLLSVFIIIPAIIFGSQLFSDGFIYQKDGIYEKITIYDGEYEGRQTRFFLQDRSASGAMFLDEADPTDLVFNYTKYYDLYKLFKPELKNALIIGGGAYSIPKALLYEAPAVNVDVAEIEPALFELAKEYFGLDDNPRLTTYSEDGRRLLFDSNKKYDLIFSDVYYSLYSIPAHFTTQEFFTIAKDRMSENGVFMANLIGSLSRQQPSLIFSEIRTFQTVFPNSYFFATTDSVSIGVQNIIMVGVNGDKNLDWKQEGVETVYNYSDLSDKIINLDRFDLSKYTIMTDNYAPVEYLTTAVLKRAGDEDGLVDGEEVLALIKEQLDYGPRYIGSSGHDEVEKMILAELGEHTDKILAQTWDYVGSDQKEYELKNIIGQLNPDSKKRIILGSHYDSKRLADKDLFHPEAPVPGANDSASGVGVLLELARLLNNASTTVGIDFVLFDGERVILGRMVITRTGSLLALLILLTTLRLSMLKSLYQKCLSYWIWCVIAILIYIEKGCL